MYRLSLVTLVILVTVATQENSTIQDFEQSSRKGSVYINRYGKSFCKRPRPSDEDDATTSKNSTELMDEDFEAKRPRKCARRSQKQEKAETDDYSFGYVADSIKLDKELTGYEYFEEMLRYLSIR